MYLYYLFGWKIDECEITNSHGRKLKKENCYLFALGKGHFFGLYM